MYIYVQASIAVGYKKSKQQQLASMKPNTEPSQCPIEFAFFSFNSRFQPLHRC